jgi:hypothetical protein
MKSLSYTMNEALFESEAKSEPVNECVIVARKLAIDKEGKPDTTETPSYVLAKNRDRSYEANLSIVHKIENGVEICILQDTDTLFAEGMNEFSLGIINASLSLADENVGTDKDKEKGKDESLISRSKFASDGVKIIHALGMTNLEDAIHMCKTWNPKGGSNGINGNTLVASDDSVYTISSTSIHPAVTSKLDGLDLIVYTNHSDVHSTAGYQPGTADYKSSATRKQKAEENMSETDSPTAIAKAMAVQNYSKKSNLNPRRSTDKLKTSSTMVLDLKNKHFHLVLYKEFIKEFKGIINLLPSDYEPKIKVTYEEV